MAVSLGDRGQSGFDEPLGLLYDCHRRIEFFLGVLIKVAEQPEQLDEAHRRALEAGLHYFRRAATKHTADEEESLFPRLRASGDPRAAEALATVESLEADHRRVQVAHEQVDDIGRRWMAQGRVPEADRQRMGQLLVRLREEYREHIRIEDEVLFPLAREVLGEAEVAAIGREMAERRGLRPCPSAEARPGVSVGSAE